MGSPALEPRIGTRIPAPAALFGFLILGGLAVWALPEVAGSLPGPGNAAQARYAATCLGVLALTGAYVYGVSRVNRALDRAWMTWTLVYGSGLAIVKFILSPIAFERSSGLSLGGSVTAGLVVMPLYILALALMYVLAVRRRGEWSLSSRVGLSIGFAVAAVTSRLLVAWVLGTASEYLDEFFWRGLVLPVVVAIASFAALGSFDHAGPALKPALHVGVSVIVAHHLLWVLYMFVLFA